MSILYLLHHRLDLLRLRHVALDHQRIIQFLRHILASDLFCPCGIGHVIDHALRAVFAEGLDHFRAETARAAGDEHDFAGEIERIGHDRLTVVVF